MGRVNSQKLVTHLVHKNNYAEWTKDLSREKAVELVFHDVLYGEVGEMNIRTLVEILDSFEFGSVKASQKELFKYVHYAGDVKETVRELVASCITFAIIKHLKPMR